MSAIGDSEELAAAAVGLLRDELSRPGVRLAAHGTAWVPEIWEAAARAGWFDLLLPEAHGGLGLGNRAAAGLFSIIGNMLIPGPYLDHVVALPEIYPYASAPVRRYLDRARSGESLIILADPCAASEVGTNRPIILPGRQLIGEVELVRYGSMAEGFVVIGDEEGAPVIVLIDASAEGVEVSDRESFDPTSSVSDVRFHHVHIPEDAILRGASRQEITALIERIRARMRVMIAAELSGLARHLLDASVEYAKVREQFRRPIGSFPQVQQILAEMTVDVLGLEAYVAECCASDQLDSLEALALKGFASHIGRQVGEGSLQVHGAIAFTIDFEDNRWLLKALTLQGVYGDELSSFRQIGESLLAEPPPEVLAEPFR